MAAIERTRFQDVEAADEPALSATGLRRSFGRPPRRVCALDDISLTVRRCELVLVLGRAGAGKSTLLNCCGGLLRPDSGIVLLAGHDLWRYTDPQRERFLRLSVGWVFQSSGLLAAMNALENTSLALEILDVSREAAATAAREILDAIGLGSRALHRPNELSGGEQQRVALARALVKRPALLFADEPTAQLDTETARAIWELLRKTADGGTAILAATHDASAGDWADRVLEIDDGRLLEP